MSLEPLQEYVPESAMPYIRKWLTGIPIHIKITRNRRSKLGDYSKRPGKGHQITVNFIRNKDLFFFILTHELAHLFAFENYGPKIAPHGEEWKSQFRNLLLESIEVYEEPLRPVIVRHARSPKANFTASPELVKYFHTEEEDDCTEFLDGSQPAERFIYQKQTYIIEQKLKKNYICLNLETGKKYIFKAMARVEKTG